LQTESGTTAKKTKWNSKSTVAFIWSLAFWGIVAGVAIFGQEYAVMILPGLFVAGIAIAGARGLHYAFGRKFTNERAQKRRVRQLRIGDQIRKGAVMGTIAGVAHDGGIFNITWFDGQKDALSWDEIDKIEPAR
jgi:prepilin-type processing-associated H-X9-DG protein